MPGWSSSRMANTVRTRTAMKRRSLQSMPHKGSACGPRRSSAASRRASHKPAASAALYDRALRSRATNGVKWRRPRSRPGTAVTSERTPARAGASAAGGQLRSQLHQRHEDGLRDIETNGGDRIHAWLPQNRDRPSGDHFSSTYVPGGEPSTASIGDK
jgi:hypothetical protein